MKALFCTDGSKISFDALENILKWVKNLSVDAISVADLDIITDNKTLDGTDFAMRCNKSVHNILEYTEKKLKDNNIKLNSKKIMCGSVVDSILEIENECTYDTLILGSNGKKGLQKWIGSVSQEIASLSKTSVYIAKEKNKCENILFAIDSSDENSISIKKLIEMLELKNKNIHLVTVFDIPEYAFLSGNIDTNWYSEIKNKQIKYSENLMTAYKKIFTNENLLIKSSSVLEGEPSTELINYAHKNSIDLVVTGRKERKYLSRFILNSVSKRILENVKSDVFIIKN